MAISFSLAQRRIYMNNCWAVCPQISKYKFIFKSKIKVATTLLYSGHTFQVLETIE